MLEQAEVWKNLGFSFLGCATQSLRTVGFGDYRQPAPGAMELADAVDVFNHTLFAIVSGIFALEVDDSDALSDSSYRSCVEGIRVLSEDSFLSENPADIFIYSVIIWCNSRKTSL